MAADIAAVTRELATLLPCLAAALTRDNTSEGHGGHITPGTPVNTDVLHAMITLHREVTTTTQHAAQLAGEPWQPRELAACLTTLPRLIDRIYQLGPPTEAMNLEDTIRRWTKTTKLALGLRLPDIPIGAPCPACGYNTPGLVAVGSEGFLRRAANTLTVEWEHPGRVHCRGCNASWGVAEWPHLGRVLATT